VAAFCRERGLCAPYFYAWKKRLREAPAGPGLAGAAREAGAAGVVQGASV
jgi:hypothetical protein